MFLRQVDDRIQFRERVNSPGFGRLGDAERAHLGRMHVEMLSENNRDRVEIEFPIFPRNGEELAAAGKNSGAPHSSVSIWAR